jgi:hypothetical protein
MLCTESWFQDNPPSSITPFNATLFSPDSAVEMTMCSDQALSLGERRHRSEQLQCRLGCLVQGWQSLPESAAAPEIASRSNPLAYCIRSGGLAA